MIDNRTYKIDGVDYRWYGGYGATLISQEWRDIRKGDVRIIHNTPMYAYTVGKNIWGKREIGWSLYVPNDRITAEHIRAFKEKLNNA